jgi:hypothetical protein
MGVMAPLKRTTGPGLPARVGERKLERDLREEIGVPPVLGHPDTGRIDAGRQLRDCAPCVSVNIREPTYSVKSHSLRTLPRAPEIEHRYNPGVADRVVAEEADGTSSSTSLEDETSMVPPDGRVASRKARGDGDWDAEQFKRVRSGPIPAFLDGIEWLTGLGVRIVRELERRGDVVAPPIDRADIREIVVSELLKKAPAMTVPSHTEKDSSSASVPSENQKVANIQHGSVYAMAPESKRVRKHLSSFQDSELTAFLKEAGTMTALGDKLGYDRSTVRKELQRRGLRERGARTR